MGARRIVTLKRYHLRSREVSLGVLTQESLSLLDADQALLLKPLDGPSMSSGITEGVPGRDQMRMTVIDLSSKAAESSLSLQRGTQSAPSSVIAQTIGEVDHVLVPDVRRQGIDSDEVQLVELDGVLAVNAGVTGPEHHLAGARIDQPTMLVVSLVGQRGGDVLDVDGVQIQHVISVGLPLLKGQSRGGCLRKHHPLEGALGAALRRCAVGRSSSIAPTGVGGRLWLPFVCDGGVGVAQRDRCHDQRPDDVLALLQRRVRPVPELRLERGITEDLLDSSLLDCGDVEERLLETNP